MGSLSTTQKIIGVGVVGIAVAGWAYAFTLSGDVATLEADLARADDLREAQESALARTEKEAEEVRATLSEAASNSSESTDANSYVAEIAEVQSKAQALIQKVAELEESNRRLREEMAAAARETQEFRAASEDPLEAFATIARVNLRSGPTTDSDVVVTLPADAKLRVFEAVAGGEWYKVGRVGYVHADFLQKVDDAQR